MLVVVVAVAVAIAVVLVMFVACVFSNLIHSSPPSHFTRLPIHFAWHLYKDFGFGSSFLKHGFCIVGRTEQFSDDIKRKNQMRFPCRIRISPTDNSMPAGSPVHHIGTSVRSVLIFMTA